MNFQWYPGHMTKAKRMMQENIKLIDLVIELVDARVPMSSRNPDIDELGKNKARLILLNKADLADEKQTEEWIGYFRGKGYSAVKVNSRKGGGIKSIQGVIQEACKEKTERDRKRGILNRPVRVDSVFIWCVSVPIAFVLSRYTGIHVLVIYACVQLADLIKCVIGFVLVKKGVWLQNIVSS